MEGALFSFEGEVLIRRETYFMPKLILSFPDWINKLTLKGQHNFILLHFPKKYCEDTNAKRKNAKEAGGIKNRKASAISQKMSNPNTKNPINNQEA